MVRADLFEKWWKRRKIVGFSQDFGLIQVQYEFSRRFEPRRALLLDISDLLVQLKLLREQFGFSGPILISRDDLSQVGIKKLFELTFDRSNFDFEILHCSFCFLFSSTLVFTELEKHLLGVFV